jgi:hypothetical protein
MEYWSSGGMEYWNIGLMEMRILGKVRKEGTKG